MTQRTFVVETYGCQMNVHDSERITGLLLNAGYVPALEDSQPDLVVFNTCAVRENADNKLYGNLSFLAPLKKSHPGFQIAVGGCMAQKDQDSIIKRAPYVDVVFGTHNLGSLPALLERARIEEESQVEIKESLEHFPSTLPVRRHSAFSAWVSVSNGTVTFQLPAQTLSNIVPGQVYVLTGFSTYTQYNQVPYYVESFTSSAITAVLAPLTLQSAYTAVSGNTFLA